MDDIKKWSLLISTVAIISGILLSILPEGKLKGAYKTLSGVIILYALLYPIMNGNRIDLSISDFLSENYEVSESIDKYALSSVISSAEKAIKELLEGELKSREIECEIEVECIEEDNEVKISIVAFVGAMTQEKRDEVIELCLSLGLSDDIIEFSGEENE